ncbi:MAG: 4Fe-4S dicluster domain-containing protein [Bacteroidales bacterium]|nr:4Fe-4S dicluster domain-containing protein [Bacteroidales bacterium]
MAQLIVTDKEKCNLSYTCIRVCPTKAIKIEDGHSHIIASRCIGCGHCVTVCAQNAISYRSDKNTTLQLIKSDTKVAALCDPAIAGEFVDISDYRKFVAMLKELGFDLVNEVAFGVDLVARKYQELYNNFHGKYYITTKCPATTAYIIRYKPDLVNNLAPIIPSYIAMAKVVRQKYGKDLKTVYITSCTSAKDEVKQFDNTDAAIDAVITFSELQQLFDDYNIYEKKVEYCDFDPPLSKKGGLFPISHGMLQTIDIVDSLLDSNVLITEGRTNFLQSLDEFSNEDKFTQHLDLFYCKGCIMGPGTTSGGKKFTRRTHVVNYVKKRLVNFDAAQWEKEIQEFQNIDLSRRFKAIDKRMPFPSEQDIHKVLADIGKLKAEDQLGCGSCGYPTCREFAIANVQGLANYEMCYTYSLKEMHNSVNKLNATNRKLQNIQQALKKSEEQAKAEKKAAKEAAETVTTMLNKIRAGVVLVNDDFKIIESNYSFINMLGEDAQIINETIPGLRGADIRSLVAFSKLFETVLHTGEDILNKDVKLDNAFLNISVFTIKKNKIVGGIIRDLTLPEVQREEIINRARNVIQENLKTVQQIAFLLGESAAKTERTLNSIIEAQKLRNGTHDTGK